jgi:diacylglycerol kinase family enzyme
MFFTNKPNSPFYGRIVPGAYAALIHHPYEGAGRKLYEILLNCKKEEKIFTRTAIRKSKDSLAGIKADTKNTATDTVLIVNPKSSSGSTGKEWQNLFIKIKKTFGGNPKVAFTKKPGDGSTLTKKFLKKGFKKIVAIGGDGTINEVANGFFEVEEKPVNHVNIGNQNNINSNNNAHSAIGSTVVKSVNSEAIMALLPSGTRNVLVKSLGIPDGIEECCRTFAFGTQKQIDVISVTATNPQTGLSSPTRIFLNAAEMGMTGEIIDKSKRIRTKIDSRLISTVSSVISTVPTYESNICEISIDDGRDIILTKVTMCVIANGKFLGGGFKAAPNADVSDGLLDVVILKDSNNIEMISNFINVKKGTYGKEDDVFYTQAKKVLIKPIEEESEENTDRKRDVTVTVDGESVGILPATFQVVPNALTIKI